MNQVPKLPIPLPELCDPNDWKRMNEFNRKTNGRVGIRKATLPQERGRLFIILPTTEYNYENVRFFKRIGVKGKLFSCEEDLDVKMEAE